MESEIESGICSKCNRYIELIEFIGMDKVCIDCYNNQWKNTPKSVTN